MAKKLVQGFTKAEFIDYHVNGILDYILAQRQPVAKPKRKRGRPRKAKAQPVVQEQELELA